VIRQFNVAFDHDSFCLKLRHYFKDTAPIYAEINVGLAEVSVSSISKSSDEVIKSVVVSINDVIGIEENIANIISLCEEKLYPKMVKFVEKGQYGVYSEVDPVLLLTQGYSLKQIHEKKNIYRNYFTIVRFNSRKNTVDFREDLTKTMFRAYLKRPLITMRDYIIQSSEKGLTGMSELFAFIDANSQLEQLNKEKVL